MILSRLCKFLLVFLVICSLTFADEMLVDLENENTPVLNEELRKLREYAEDYTDDEIEGLVEENLGIYHYMDNAWHRCLNTGVNVEENIVWAWMYRNETAGSPILIGTPPVDASRSGDSQPSEC